MKAESKSILRFMMRWAWMALVPLSVAIALYVWDDPFMVLRRYDNYYPDVEACRVRVSLNRGMTTLNDYERQVALGAHYNAFIFGSSISIHYRMSDWIELLNDPDARGFHFDSSFESLQSMARKVKYLDSKGAHIKYALIVLDARILKAEPEVTPPYADPPQLLNSLSELMNYHYVFLRASTNADFLKSYLAGRLTDEPLWVGRNPVFEQWPYVYDPQTNELTVPSWDKQLDTHPGNFYRLYPLQPIATKDSISPARIMGEKSVALQEISRIMHRQGTRVQVIMSPNRDRVLPNPADLKSLADAFGSQSVHDLSGMYNLLQDSLMYDPTHYRSPLARRFMQEALRQKQ